MRIGEINPGHGLRHIEFDARRTTGNPAKRLKIVGTPAHPFMAERVASLLDVPLSPVSFTKAASGIWEAKFLSSVRGADLFIIHTANTGEINENMMQLHALITAISKLPKRDRPARVVVSSLHFPYARQERKAVPREPISAAAMAHMITGVHYTIVSGTTDDLFISVGEKRIVDRIMIVNLHASAIEGFFSVPVDHIDAITLAVNFAKQMVADLNNLVFTGPDLGRVKAARKAAELTYRENADEHLATIFKIRGKKNPATGETETVSRVNGDVKGKVVVVIDDMADTFGTAVKAADALIEAGAKKVYFVFVHGLLSGPAVERLLKSKNISKIGIVDTLSIPPEKLQAMGDKVVILPIERLLKTVIERTFKGQSILGYQSES